MTYPTLLNVYRYDDQRDLQLLMIAPLESFWTLLGIHPDTVKKIGTDLEKKLVVQHTFDLQNPPPPSLSQTIFISRSSVGINESGFFIKPHIKGALNYV